MSRQTKTLAILAVCAVLVAGNAMAQTPPTTPPPTAQTPPAASTAKPAPTPVVLPPFPPESKIGFVDLQAVVSQSILGKAGTTQLEQLQKRLGDELTGLQTKLRDAQTRQQTQASLLSEAAAAQLAKDIDRLTRELQFKQQEAQSEVQTLQQDLLADFEKKVLPILEALAKEKNLHAVFNVADSGAVYVFPGLNLSPELVKRVDGQYSAKK
ncbi:MAG TPA: OmpH family outer membrane protein [Vicinamibacterales bacterium]|nr:OmpH family outer membrane protein [Vicinamibacterales bacterium]